MSMSAIRLDFSELLSCKDLNVTGKTLLLLYCPKLQDISGKLSIADNPLYEVSFPALTHLGELSLSCPKVNQMNMPLLKAIDGNASISIAGFNPEQLASLESIGGTLSLTSARRKMNQNAKIYGENDGFLGRTEASAPTNAT